MIQLREYHCYDKGTNSLEKIYSGNIVLEHDEHHPQGFWKLARVEKLIEGSDGQARGAVIHIYSRGTKTSLLRCPLKCLYPLEIWCKQDETGQPKSAESNLNEQAQPEEESSQIPRPKRAAAERAEKWLETVLTEQDSEQ